METYLYHLPNENAYNQVLNIGIMLVLSGHTGSSLLFHLQFNILLFSFQNLRTKKDALKKFCLHVYRLIIIAIIILARIMAV